MTVRKPLVLIDGIMCELPNSDVVANSAPDYNAGYLTVLGGEWKAYGAGTAAPATGSVYPNPGDSSLFMHKTDALGQDRSVEISKIVANDKIWVRDPEANYALYKITGVPLDLGTYCSFPIVLEIGSWTNIITGANSKVTFSKA